MNDRMRNFKQFVNETYNEPIAPNGKKSNLNRIQYDLVRSDSFKQWFGDWENEPETASKVVDENGEPLVVYHTTENVFSVFDEGFIFFSKDIISHFGNIIMKSFMNLRKPYILHDAGSWGNIVISNRDEDSDKIYNDIIDIVGEDGIVIENVCDWAKKNGYDGVIAKNIFETEDGNFMTDDYVAFDPNQIKLAE